MSPRSPAFAGWSGLFALVALLALATSVQGQSATLVSTIPTVVSSSIHGKVVLPVSFTYTGSDLLADGCCSILVTYANRGFPDMPARTSGSSTADNEFEITNLIVTPDVSGTSGTVTATLSATVDEKANNLTYVVSLASSTGATLLVSSASFYADVPTSTLLQPAEFNILTMTKANGVQVFDAQGFRELRRRALTATVLTALNYMSQVLSASGDVVIGTTTTYDSRTAFDHRFGGVFVTLTGASIASQSELDAVVALLDAHLNAFAPTTGKLYVISDFFGSTFTAGSQTLLVVARDVNGATANDFLLSADVATYLNNALTGSTASDLLTHGISALTATSAQGRGLILTNEGFFLAGNGATLTAVRSAGPKLNDATIDSSSCNIVWQASVSGSNTDNINGVATTFRQTCTNRQLIYRSLSSAFMLVTSPGLLDTRTLTFSLVGPVVLADSEYHIGSGFAENVDVDETWSAERCAEYQPWATIGLQSVLACSEAANSPTYRKLVFDLGGEFALKELYVTLPHYPLPYPVAESLATQPRHADASSSLKSRLELWVASASGAWVDATDSISDDFAAACTGLGQRDQPCEITFEVLSYLRDSQLGNAGIRYVSLVFDGIEDSTRRLPAALRVFEITEVVALGTCLCNGHSASCDIADGSCDSCGHLTSGSDCGVCSNTAFTNKRNSPDFAVNSCSYDSAEMVDGVFACDGPSLAEIDASEIESLVYEHGTFSGLIVPGVPVRDLSRAVFQKFFANGGPCDPCTCFGHSNAEVTNNFAIRVCDADSGVCDCAASHNVHGDHCETCDATYCRDIPACSPAAYAYEQCHIAGCLTRCDCNGHSTLPQVGGFDQCEGDGCGCSCNAADGVTGAHCESCLPNYFSSTGNGVDGETCEPCFCNGHKGSPDTCDVTGGNCDQVGDPCQDNTTGHNCELCLEGFFRPFRPDGSIDLSDGCIACDCNGHGIGPGLCNPDGGVCSCDPSSNSEGDQCQSCIVGFWSATGTAEDGVSCTACQCNTHKDYVDNECNALGGDCMTDFDGNPQPCADQTNGTHCEHCNPTFYRPCLTPIVSGVCGGVDLTYGCQSCNCNHHAAIIIGGGETCDEVGGICDCAPSSHTTGNNCEFCEENYQNPFGSGVYGACFACSCWTHSETCSAIGTCTNCRDNTTGVSCGDCFTNYKRNTIYPDYDTPEGNKRNREQGCQACNCHGHAYPSSTTTGFGICNPNTGLCRSCGNHTLNGPLGECDTCVPGYFRQLTSAGFAAADDVCGACNFVNGKCSEDTLEDICRPCSEQCFGSNTMCGANTGVCSQCGLSNAESHRCASCQNGFFGNPSEGIPCTPCKCYHSAPSKFDLLTETEIGTFQQCLFDNSIGGVSGGAQSCILDHSVNTIDAAADPQSAILCSCPRSIPGGFFNIIASGVVYEGRTCDSCNQDAYFGQPTQCLIPGVGGSGLGDCLSFDTCNECICNGNIDESSMMDNCDYSAGNPSNLICEACLGHSTGPNCEVCEVGYYGDPTRLDTPGTIGTGFILDGSGESLKCFQCDCNGHSIARVVPGTEGDVHNDTCTTVAPGFVGNYTCDCDSANGYTGPTCRECLLGYEQIALGSNLFRCDPCDNCTRDAADIIYGLIDEYAALDTFESDIATSVAAVAVAINDLKAILGIARRDASAANIVAALPLVGSTADRLTSQREQLSALLANFEASADNKMVRVRIQSLLKRVEDSKLASFTSQSESFQRLAAAADLLSTLIAKLPQQRERLASLESALAQAEAAFLHEQDWIDTNLDVISAGLVTADRMTQSAAGLRAAAAAAFDRSVAPLALVLSQAEAVLRDDTADALQSVLAQALADIQGRLTRLESVMSNVRTRTATANAASTTERLAQHQSTISALGARLALIEGQVGLDGAIEQAHASLLLVLQAADIGAGEFVTMVDATETELRNKLAALDPTQAPHVSELIAELESSIAAHRDAVAESSKRILTQVSAEASIAATAASESLISSGANEVARVVAVQTFLSKINTISNGAVAQFTEAFAGERVLAIMRELVSSRRRRTVELLTPLERETFAAFGEAWSAAKYETMQSCASVLDQYTERLQASIAAFTKSLTRVQLNTTQVALDMTERDSMKNWLSGVAQELKMARTDSLAALDRKISARAGQLAASLDEVVLELSVSVGSVRNLAVAELMQASSKVADLPAIVAATVADLTQQLANLVSEIDLSASQIQQNEQQELERFVGRFGSDMAIIRTKISAINELVNGLEEALNEQADALDVSATSARATLREIAALHVNLRAFLTIPASAELVKEAPASPSATLVDQLRNTALPQCQL
ncbi:hypothetical protein CAOG_02741 [Capsaspora owczarzaki ATCC 30864]|uniref:TNFR-Cys domain-containing protein n=1 Tax=Capsaspora owczarzaki (strain ATCC 30864) TaxID=595528 RepID=A0A0D2WMZ2_CAPO3|nr:hypothetical protein CAOG_02741 [Capsaspora owczarzaki ATCC 30864]KJE91628.1 hypothetical protein CAOG_002741 [Capsaspora owczarzaki ATCC 30864]|eukprot:XP_004349491.1 hypothetical protein CAOG_02741 [Capsaspora owczarzaki ATCC 30864]